MLEKSKEKKIRDVYIVGLCVKGIGALFEIIGGVVVTVISHDFVLGVIESLTDGELSQDPNDFVAQHLNAAAQAFSLSAQHFAAFYLLLHGIIKLFLIIALLKNKLWAYPLTLFFMGLFIVYQVYKFFVTHSLWMFCLTIFDLIIVSLIWHEYKLIKRVGEKTVASL